MPIREVLIEIIDHYPQNKFKRSAINPAKTWFGLDAPSGLRESIALATYKVKASPGMGNNAADVPWIGIRRPDITQGFTGGVYVVYLFPKDRSGVYLSLNQGVTNVLGERDDYHPTAAGAVELRRRRDGLRLILDVPDQFSYEPIFLRSAQARGRQYEDGHICGKFYDRNAFPQEEDLIGDLSALLQFYDTLEPERLAAADLPDRATGTDANPGPKRAYRIGRPANLVTKPAKDVDLEAWRQAQERAKRSHQTLLDAVAAAAQKAELDFGDTKHIDLIVDDTYIVEAKSVRRRDDRAQVRAALAQLYDYKFTYRETYPDPILVAVFDAEPVRGLGDFLVQCNIHVFWKTATGFEGHPASRDRVGWLR